MNGRTGLLKIVACAVVASGLAAQSSHAASKCVKFDLFAAGTTFTATFVANGVTIDVLPFYYTVGFPCAGPTTFGFAQVNNSGHVPGGSPPRELQVNNVRLEFHMLDFVGAPIVKLKLKYGEYGGQVDLSINGDCYVLNDFTDLPIGIYAGVKYKRTANKIVLVSKTSTIDEFAIGGQELWIDDVCASN